MRILPFAPCTIMFAAAALFPFAIAPAPASAQQPATRAQAEQDPILKAMLVELGRNQKRLQLENSEKPYFIEFRIDDVVEYTARAQYGALTGEHDSHSRVARVRVRVGDYKFDNSHAKVDNQVLLALQRFGFGGDGMIAIEVIDDDPVALRFALWNAADLAYKIALDDFAKKQAELKTVETPPQAGSFAQEKPTINLAPVLHLSLDRDAWKRNIIDGSALPLTDPTVKNFAPQIEESSGELRGRVRTEYLVNSEGAIVRKSFAEYHAEIAFNAQAADGMKLARSYPVNGSAADGLGTAEHFHDGALHALTGLDELCKAPVVRDEYHGPVLLAGNASARSFGDLLPSAVEARPPALGSTARTTGAYNSSYQTRVLPDFLSILDDPTLTTFSGKELTGTYTVDDEGVPAQKVALVQDGKLVSYLLGREPIRDFPESNGHGRAAEGQAPAPSIGVLKVEASNGVSEDELLKKLIAMGKDQGLPNVYMVATLGGPSQPRTMYRIKVEDGSRELVRGAALGELNLHTFRSGIVAAGDTPYVYNIFGDVPKTVIAPPLLIDDLTVKQAQERDARLPFYPAPAE
jgi:predicted Zn-dependent protease